MKIKLLNLVHAAFLAKKRGLKIISLVGKWRRTKKNF